MCEYYNRPPQGRSGLDRSDTARRPERRRPEGLDSVRRGGLGEMGGAEGGSCKNIDLLAQ